MLTSPPSLTVVTVTYGDRADLVRDTLSSVAEIPGVHIVVVSNGSAPPTLSALQAFQEQHPELLEIIDFAQNRGSAPAFAAGLRRAYDLGAPVLILDDDNPVGPDVWRVLPDLATRVEQLSGAPAGLAVHRPVNAAQRAVIAGVPTSEVFEELRPGAFHGFDLFSRIHSRLGGLPHIDTNVVEVVTEEVTVRAHRIPVVMWGGVYLTARAVALRALPEPDLVLYGDDNDFSRRFRELGGELFLIEGLTISDTDAWRPAGAVRQSGWRSLFPSTFRTSKHNTWRLQYLFRNQAYLSSRQSRGGILPRVKLVTNASIRISAVLALSLLAGRPRLGAHLTAASIAGLREKLGRSYPLP